MERTATRGREEGESPYDYCLHLIDEGRLKRAGKWIEKGRVEERALRKILQDQIMFVRRIRKALEKEKPAKAERLRRCLISPVVRQKFKTDISALRSRLGEAVEEDVERKVDNSPTIEESLTTTQEPVSEEHGELSLARGLLMKKLGKEAGRYSEEALERITRIIETTWLRERGGKHTLGVGLGDLLVMLEFLSAGNGTVLTLEMLHIHLHRSESSIRESVRELQRNYLRGSGCSLEGDINGEGVCLI